MKGALAGGVAAILAIVVAIWLFVFVVKIALKLIGLAIVAGLVAAAYFAIRKRIGSGDAR